MTFLEVKNWAEFQHYKDRNPVWVKLYLALLDDYDFARLSDAERGQLMMVWLLAARTEGRVPNDAKWIAGRIACSGPFKLKRLVESGWLIPVEVGQDDTELLAEPERNRSLDKDKEKEGEKEGDAQRGREEFVGRFPEHFRDAVRGALRAANQPEMLIQSIEGIVSGLTPPPYSYPVIGQALQEIAVSGDKVTAMRLRTFCRTIATPRRDADTGEPLSMAEQTRRWANEAIGDAA